MNKYHVQWESGHFKTIKAYDEKHALKLATTYNPFGKILAGPTLLTEQSDGEIK